MLLRSWLFLLSYYFRYIIIIILLSILLFLFNCISTSIFSIANKISTQHLFLNQTLSKIQLPFTNRTVRLAVVSAVYDDNYIEGVEVLGYSLKRINIQADLILFYISNRLNQSTLDRCRKVGWY